MVSFSFLDYSIIFVFFLSVIFVGLWAGRKSKNNNDEDYLLSGRSIGLFLFVLTNVSTWYGGILGVGEFTYSYGLVSWFTQGLPYYIFALIFALLLSKKIRQASLFTIPQKIEQVYGKKASSFAALLVFILVSPAPYLLMAANLFSLIFEINIFYSIIVVLIISTLYLIKGGYRSDVYTDVIQFFVMFIGFIILLYFSYSTFGGYDYLESNLPSSHLQVTGGASPLFIIVWFLIALWTFADPGFHQRCYAAKSPEIAKKGIIISILFWAFFDFLTTSSGLFARAALPDLSNPVNSYPMLAEKILSKGFKGLFYAGLFASIFSTLNSFLFLSATTFSNDFINQVFKKKSLKHYAIYGLLTTAIISGIMAYMVPSVIRLWYLIGSICIPGIILSVLSAYFEKLRVPRNFILAEIILAPLAGIVWYLIKDKTVFNEIEPMIIGLLVSIIVHLLGKVSSIVLHDKQNK